MGVQFPKLKFTAREHFEEYQEPARIPIYKHPKILDGASYTTLRET